MKDVNGDPSQRTFEDCLRLSHEHSDLPVWEEIYRQAWPSFASMVDHRENGWWQKSGVDRSVILENSKQILIDEKVRPIREDKRVFHDIALEYLHVPTNGRAPWKGWVEASLRADFLAYCVVALRLVYLLPVEPLQAAWREHGHKWREKYGTIEGKTWGQRGEIRFRSKNCPVPPGVLYAAIGQWHRINY